MTGLRAAKKAATRRAVQEHALRLFLEHGYEATTVEQIAAAAGVSHMTFFRHFPTKESVVETDDYDPLLAAHIRAGPMGEDPVESVRTAITGGLAAVMPADRDAILQRTRLVLTTPALRAHQADNQHATAELFAGALAERDGLRAAPYALRVRTAAMVAALTVALREWVASDGERDLVALVDEAFAVLRT